jgi:hypothetical protein
MLIQLDKIAAFSKWGGLGVNAKKCNITGILHGDYHTGLIPKNSSPTDIRRLRNQLEGRLIIEGTAIPFLPADLPYCYLGMHITMTLN